MELYFYALLILAGLAIADLIVGVSNDAVNFLNSSIGSRVAPRNFIMIIASLGILAGVTFSSGMMEVARKGIFHPQFFKMPELMVIFLAVMITDIILLDLFNTFSLPTSTTVSIVFELLGAAVTVSTIKLIQADKGFRALMNYINTSKALAIISGILLSVIIAFLAGAFIQLITRLIFTFDYKKRLKRYGGVWGGIALSAIIYFILIKGAKGASFITPKTLAWIKNHTFLILLASFFICGLILQVFLIFTKFNILKLIILIGTFALAMAFAANDLVNFIGVPMAGLSSFNVAQKSGQPLTTTMDALQGQVKSNTLLLLLAGIIMVATLWISRKAKSVTKTEINLGRQEAGVERFGSSPLSRTIVRMVSSMLNAIRNFMSEKLHQKIHNRLDQTQYQPEAQKDGKKPCFDLLRASVNLMVASIIISLATSMKLPLSTTYITFMVAMGTSLSDRAWGSESAVYRVTGVLTVVGGWFFTAFTAFLVSSIIASIIFLFKAPIVIIILGITIIIIFWTHKYHHKREDEEEKLEIFNLRKITDAKSSIDISFDHTAIFLERIKELLDESFEGLFSKDRQQLKLLKNESKNIQSWANIIIANIYKILRLLSEEEVEKTQSYSHIINNLQTIAESYRDIIMRGYLHIDNNHTGLLDEQIQELREIKEIVLEMLEKTSKALSKKEHVDIVFMIEKYKNLKHLSDIYDKKQIKRIQNRTSKTRLSILFYGLIRDIIKIADKTHDLMDIFYESFKLDNYH